MSDAPLRADQRACPSHGPFPGGCCPLCSWAPRVVTGCEWQSDEEGIWSTSCGKAFVLSDGGPIANEMKYCCYCGLVLDELPYEEPEVADDE